MVPRTSVEYEEIPDGEFENSLKTRPSSSSRWKKVLVFFTSLLATAIAFYVFIVLPLTNINTLPLLQKTTPLNVKLIPTKSTSFQEDDTISKEQKYITKKKWEALHSEDSEEKERLILIGDVHGSLQYLKNLLSKVNFNKEKDQVIFLGDLITKGTNSIATLEYAMQNNFKGVLGNHELNVLSKHIGNGKVHFNDEDYFQLPQRKIRFDDESLLSKNLNSTHYEYITSLPFVMDLGLVPHISDDEEEKLFLPAIHGIADHMGVAFPKRSFEEIKIDDCLDIEKDWYFSYNNIMSKKKRPTVVYYGHHAGKGLNIREFTKGLDSGCVYGDQLSAVVVWTETIVTKKEKELIVYKSELVQVECSDNES